MNEPEAFQLLTLASARDGRTVSQSVARVWADDLSWIDLAEAVAAARMHYRESDKWLMPAHVVKNVLRIRDDVERAERVERAKRGIGFTPMPPRPENYEQMVQAAIEKSRRERAKEVE